MHLDDVGNDDDDDDDDVGMGGKNLSLFCPTFPSSGSDIVKMFHLLGATFRQAI